MLDGIGRTFIALKNETKANKALVLSDLRQRGGAYTAIVALAESTSDRDGFLQLAVREWLEASREHAIEKLLPGFVN